MIQRIQSLFMLAIAACMLMVLFFPIWSEINHDNTQQIVFTAFKTETVALPYNKNAAPLSSGSTIYIALLAIAAAVIAALSIFQYKNRLNQMKLGALNSLIMAATLGLSYYNVYQLETTSPQTQGAFLMGFFMPVAAMIFNMMSNRFIRKDEKLVKSVDRIR